MEFDHLLKDMQDKIFIIPKQEDKLVKIVFEGLFCCPILFNLGIDHRCKHAKDRLEDLNYTIYCDDINNCETIEFKSE